MLINETPPFNRRKINNGVKSQIKQSMEGGAGPKRRRYTSEASGSSTSTQLTSISDDPQSPTDVTNQYNGRPMFRLGSQDSGQPPTPGVGNGVPMGGMGFRKSSLESPFNTSEARRVQIKASRIRGGRRQSESTVTGGRRQSESVITEHSEINPHRSHTTSCMGHNISMQDEADETFHKQPLHHINQFNSTFGSRRSMNGDDDYNPNHNQYNHGDCNHGNLKPGHYNHGDFYNQHPGTLFPTQRARSVDALESVRTNIHLYDAPYDVANRLETEVLLGHDAHKPVVRVTGGKRRLNSSTSETPPLPEPLNPRERLNDDEESGYIRTVHNKAGFCENLSFCTRRYGLTLLIVLNVLLLIVVIAGVPFVLLKREEGKSSCFECSILRPTVVGLYVDQGYMVQEDEETCCFKSRDRMTSWMVKQLQSDRPYIFRKGREVIKVNGKHRIRWDEHVFKSSHVDLEDHRTAMRINEPGYYFMFSRVQYCATRLNLPAVQTIEITPSTQTSELYSYEQNALNNGCNRTEDKRESVLETMAFLNADQVVYIEVNKDVIVNTKEDHMIGLFRVAQ